MATKNTAPKTGTRGNSKSPVKAADPKKTAPKKTAPKKTASA